MYNGKTKTKSHNPYTEVPFPFLSFNRSLPYLAHSVRKGYINTPLENLIVLVLGSLIPARSRSPGLSQLDHNFR